MEVFLGIVAVALLIGVIAAANKSQQREAEAKAAEAADARAMDVARIRESEVTSKLPACTTPAAILSLCDHAPPPSMRFLKSEDPLWVVPDCRYIKTKKEVTYQGRSGGVSVRVARGVSVRSGGSRGTRPETETLVGADTGTVVLTTKHLYFEGQEWERFRVRLDKLVTAHSLDNGFLFQRDGVRARPEGFISHDARMIAVLLDHLENPADPTGDQPGDRQPPDELLDGLAAGEAESAGAYVDEHAR